MSRCVACRTLRRAAGEWQEVQHEGDGLPLTCTDITGQLVFHVFDAKPVASGCKRNVEGSCMRSVPSGRTTDGGTICLWPNLEIRRFCEAIERGRASRLEIANSGNFAICRFCEALKKASRLELANSVNFAICRLQFAQKASRLELAGPDQLWRRTRSEPSAKASAQRSTNPRSV